MVTVNIWIDGAIESIGNAIGALFVGDLALMAQELLKTIPVVGAFAVLYGLTYFMGVISIFKSEEHHKFARWFALGISLIGIMTAPVIEFIIVFFGGPVLIIALLIVVVSFIVSTWMKARKSHHEIMQGVNESATGRIQSRRARKSEAHTRHIEKKAQSTEKKVIKKARNFFKKGRLETRDSIKSIDDMIELLGKINAIGNDTKAKADLQSQLASIFTKFTKLTYKEYQDVSSLEQQISLLKNTEIHQINLEKDSEIKQKNAIVAYINSIVGKSITVDLEKKQKEAILKHILDLEVEQLVALKERTIALDVKRVELEKKIEAYIKYVKHDISDNLSSLRNKLNTDLTSGLYPSAMNILHKIKEDLQKTDKIQGNISIWLAAINKYSDERVELEKDYTDFLEKLTSHDIIKVVNAGNYDKAIELAKKSAAANKANAKKSSSSSNSSRSGQTVSGTFQGKIK